MRCVVAVLAVLVAASSAQAATFGIAGFAGTVPIIDVNGPMVEGDDQKFTLFANAIPSAVVRFDSPGGQLWAGLNIGEAIARKGYATFVGSGHVCASACGFAWMAGRPRGKAPTAMVGFHGAYAQINGRMEQTGSGNAMVGAYMTNLHFGYPAVVFATTARPDAMLWLTPDTARQSGITYEVHDEVETTFWTPSGTFTPAAAPSPDLMRELLDGAEEPSAPTTAQPYTAPPGKPVPKPPKRGTIADVYPKKTDSVFDPSDISKILNAPPPHR